MASARLNLSIPADLHHRMQEEAACTPRRPNWSAIAAAAFESYLRGESSEEKLLWCRYEIKRLRKMLSEIRKLTDAKERRFDK